MSESCPNCGSAVNENSRYNVGEYQKYECGCMTSGFGDSRKACPTQACRLIRSLREELAAANQVIEGLEPLAKYYVEHKERCYDQMTKGKQGRTFARDSAIWARQQYNQALRNNEHRSDT